MKFLSKLEQKTECWFLIIISFIFFLLRFPSFFEPVWYGDEGIYQVIGLALNHGRLLYRDIWDNKPPLLYILYAIFHADQPIIRFVSCIFGLASIVLFYFLARKLFTKQSIIYCITSVFALLLGLPVLEGNIANAENFIMPLVLGAGLLVIALSKQYLSGNSSLKKLHATNYVLLTTVGFLLSLAFLFKIVAVFDLGAFTLFLIFMHLKNLNVKNIKGTILELIPVYIGFLLPIGITILYFAVNHALSDFIHSAFLNNISYVNYANQVGVSTVHIPQGWLLLKLLLLLIICVTIYIKRQDISPSKQFIFLWFAFSLFSALFSQRPYTHYLLVLLSSFCLFGGLALEKSKSQILLVGVGFLVSFYIIANFSFYNKVLGYYENFLLFMTDKKIIKEYRAFFDGSTPRDYGLADFLKLQMHPQDSMFLWGNNGQLYALTNTLPPGRYIVEYHMTTSPQTLAETQQIFYKTKPRFVVVMPNVAQFPFLLNNYSQRLVIDNAAIYEREF